MALIAALLGWMFDGAEMGLFSMVGRDAIKDLLHLGAKPNAEGEALIGFLFGVVIAVFLIGAATGGVLFGWLGDRIGRVRAMSLSVLTYALFTGACGLVTEAWQIAILRFIAALGMGGEWSLGVALVMEVWPNRSRALMAGLIGAAANVGYLLVGLLGIALISVLGQIKVTLLNMGLPPAYVESLVMYKGWRILMILGATPALLTFLIRLFVPESTRWKEEHARGTTTNWATQDLFGVLVGALGPGLIVLCWSIPTSWLEGQSDPRLMLGLIRGIGTVVGLALATWGYTFPVVRYIQRVGVQDESLKLTVRRMLLAAGLSGVALLGTWGSAQWAPTWADKLAAGPHADATTQLAMSHAKEWTQIAMGIGAIIGTIGAALAGDLLGRRTTYCLMCIISFVSMLYLFQTNTAYGDRFLVSCFIAGMCTASFYCWLPLYLPELFSTKVRATCQGFSFNFGRILAAVGALQTGALFSYPDQVFWGYTFKGGHPLACSLMSLVYLVGLGLIWTVPETKGQPLPE